MYNHLFKSGLFILTLAVFVSCEQKKEALAVAPPPPVQVDVMVASYLPIHLNVEANGTVLSEESVDIHPEVSGRLTYLQVPDGVKVSAGTILARVNDQELQAQLSKSKAQCNLAEKTADRMKQLLSIHAIQQAEYDQALSQLEAMQAELQLIQAQLDKTVVKAPFSGELGLRYISPGAFVTPATTITTLRANDMLKIDFTIPESYLSWIKKGQTIRFAATDSIEGEAVVTAMETQADLSTRNIRVRALTRNKKIYPGSFVKVSIASGEGKQAIFVPTNALIPDASSSKLIVMKGGKGEMIKVTTGYRSATGVEITSGINEGDSVVVKGVLFVKKGASLKVKLVKTPGELMNDIQ